MLRKHWFDEVKSESFCSVGEAKYFLQMKSQLKCRPLSVLLGREFAKFAGVGSKSSNTLFTSIETFQFMTRAVPAGICPRGAQLGATNSCKNRDETLHSTNLKYLLSFCQLLGAGKYDINCRLKDAKEIGNI